MAFLFVIYLSISLLIIIFPKMHFGKRVTQIYKRYISPGPFFTASRITETNLLYISWKSDGHWTTPVNPPYGVYKKFFGNWNPTLMYKSRMERSIYEDRIRALRNQVDTVANKPMIWKSSYFINEYVPVNADSIRIMLISNISEHYQTKSDTLQIVTF